MTPALHLSLALGSLHKQLTRQAGQTMAEYGILLAVISLIVVLAATLLGANVSTLFSSTGGSL